MSELTDEIARLEKLVGLTSHTNDGETVSLDPAETNRKLARLKRKAGKQRRRKQVTEINIGGTR